MDKSHIDALMLPIKLREVKPKKKIKADQRRQDPTPQAMNVAPPSEWRLFKRGMNKTQKGNYLFDDKSAAEVMKRADEWGNDFHGDWHHDSVERKVGDPPVDATVWFNLEIRDGELWAVNMKWVQDAAAKVATKKYRYGSPVFLFEDVPPEEAKKGVDGRIVEFINLALTNDPATNKMTPLIAAERAATETTPKEAPKMKALLARLSLSEAATETEALAKLDKALRERDALIVATGEIDATKAEATIVSLRDNRVAMKKKLFGYSKKMKRMKRAKKMSLLGKATKEGRITPAQRKLLQKKNLKFVRAYLKLAIEKKAPGRKTEDGTSEPRGDEANTVVQLTKIDREVMEQLGVTEKAFAASKAKGIKREMLDMEAPSKREKASA